MSALSERIETMISAGKLAPGDRLPAERQLAVDFGVSRSRLREAIKQLVSRGLLISQPGGGTYVTSPEEAEPIRAALLPLAPLAQSETGYWRDVIEIRKSLEGDAAASAALRADTDDKARIQEAYDALAAALLDKPTRSAGGSPTLAKLDAHFHMTIARATHNAVLHQVMTGLEGLLEASISGSLARLYRLPGVPGALDTQHRRILQAILSGLPDDARKAATEHLFFVESQLESLEEDVARQRRTSHAFHQIQTRKEAR